MFSTPILFLIFNRPEKTKIVFEEIKKQQPKYLFIAADGPRPKNLRDQKLCEQARAIMKEISWDCEVKTLFRDTNAGCGVAPSEAITWFFENVEQGIILEDDVLPDQSFFWYCEKMLNYFKDDSAIMHISGSYFLESLTGSNQLESYYFTKHIHVWGWATWKRAWNHYDYDMKEWPYINSDEALSSYYGDYSILWKDIFSSMYKKATVTWDYQWMFTIYKQDGIAINPTSNLTKNIGFDDQATHTTDIKSTFTDIKLSSLKSFTHCVNCNIDSEKDNLFYTYFLELDIQFEIAKRKISWRFKTYIKKLKEKLQTYL